MFSFQNVQLDDEVLISSGGFRTLWNRAKVTRITSTQFEANGVKFRKADGRLVGSGSWSSCSARPFDPEIWDSYLKEVALIRMRNEVAQIQWSNVTPEVLAQVHALVVAKPAA